MPLSGCCLKNILSSLDPVLCPACDNTCRCLPSAAARLHLYNARPSSILVLLPAGDSRAAEESGAPHLWAGLPYRMVFAVATLNSVLLYHTQVPFF